MLVDLRGTRRAHGKLFQATSARNEPDAGLDQPDVGFERGDDT
jgi:hypothetical protein